MARALREPDEEGAMHHVFVRGVARSAIAVDADDYVRTFELLERTSARFSLRFHAWCYLPNHAHLLVTSAGNLSKAMHWLGTCTAQSFNERHERSGHLYQGRFGSRRVEDNGYLLELARYLPLNPVRAALSATPEAWPWSSYAATIGIQPPPRHLDPTPFVDLLGSREAYVGWVQAGITDQAPEVPRPPPISREPSLTSLLADPSDAAIARAHHGHGYGLAAIAGHLGLSRWTVQRRIAHIAREDGMRSPVGTRRSSS